MKIMEKEVIELMNNYLILQMILEKIKEEHLVIKILINYNLV